MNGDKLNKYLKSKNVFFFLKKPLTDELTLNRRKSLTSSTDAALLKGGIGN